MSRLNSSKKGQDYSERVLNRALNRAAAYLESEEWSFGHFSNVFHDAALPGEGENLPPAWVSAQDSVMPYVERFTAGRVDAITGYELNEAGRSLLRLEFEDLGSGQLVARLYNDFLPEGRRLAETYLVSLMPGSGVRVSRDAGNSIGRAARDVREFELSLMGIQDLDGSHSTGIGALNTGSGVLSMIETSIGLESGLTASAQMMLTAHPM